VLLSIGQTKKQIARLTNTKSVILTRIGAVLNIEGSYLLYLLYVSSKKRLVESYIVVYSGDRYRFPVPALRLFSAHSHFSVRLRHQS
jgi:hypothetical protein